MTEQGDTLIAFERELKDFERNRMYPPEYRKGSVMIKVSMKHYTALSQVEMLLQPTLKRGLEPRHRDSIETQLKLIDELKRFILQELFNPKLPLVEPEA